MEHIDHIEADDYSAIGKSPIVIVEVGNIVPACVPIQAPIIGLDRSGNLRASDHHRFDVLLTTFPNAPRPWISIPDEKFDAHCQSIEARVRQFPIAATVLCQTMRLAEQLSFDQGLIAESLAYSTLLGGFEFRRWRTGQNVFERSPRSALDKTGVVFARADDQITLTLNDVARRNAMTAPMRDALYAALANVLDDASNPQLVLNGAGKCFSTGGHLAEFGTAKDLAAAHVIRSLHSCARALHALGNRAEIHLHGACIGSGIEIACAANKRIAAPSSHFQLPELAMGLIPGAGGTVTIQRAIGRHRATWMALTGKRISATVALEFGLIHAIVPR